MALSWPVLLAVLFAALLHASWNAIVKSSKDKALDTALIHLFGSLATLPLIVLIGWPRAEAWPFIVASVFVHIAYYAALTAAYEYGDLGLTYPLMRGVPPLLVAVSASIFLGEKLPFSSWVGVLAICCGVVILGLSRQALRMPRAVAYALFNAVVIAIYTLIDAMGARASGNALQYVVTLFALDGWPFALIVLARRRGLALSYARQRWPVAAGGALASLGSYAIALWAMTRAPVALVSALRETSVLFATLIGAWLLKEHFSLQRLVAALIIVAGVIAMQFA